MNVINIDSLPTEPLDALQELSRAGAELETLVREQVAAARTKGATWEEIGERLGVSRQAAWEYYTRDARRIINESANRGEMLGEDDALRLATEEVAGIRHRRRRDRS
ncbi:MAG TPA: hypothetical protein VMQ46_09750 [Acidimicrobiia bacterium]|nr:hypothetical protein [Acidimicrobiia bacterium]